MKKRILAILMALCMVMTVMPTALAEGDAEPQADTQTEVEKYVAQVDETYYTSLGSAIQAAAADGGTVTLLKDVESQYLITIKGTVTIDLNGYNITFASNTGFRLDGYNAGDLTLIGSGTVEAKAYALSMTGSKEDDGKEFVAKVGEGVTLKSPYAVTIFQNGDASYGVDLTVDGRLEGLAGIFVLGNITQTEGNIPKISLSKTAEIEATGLGVAINGYADVTVDGATITGINSAIEIRAGELVINDGTFTATATEYKENKNSSGTSVIGAALAISQHTTKKNISVTINGGEFDGVYALRETDVQNEDTTENVDIVEITGGTFFGTVKSDDCDHYIKGGSFDESVDPEYLAEDRTVELNNNGTYTYHETVEDALAAADEGAVITDTTDPDAEPITVVTVTFEGAKEKPITVLPGTEIELPTPDDTRDEIFRYWTVAGDPIGTRYYGGETVEITEDITFVANWKDNSYIPIPPTQPTKPTKPAEPDEPDEPEEPVESELPFTDVDVDDTFYEAVKYVSENGLMTGVDTTAFAPYNEFTRAQVATILYRLEKEPAVAFAATFPDVQENQWFASAVLWGNSKGILLGHDTGKFGPDDGVTFEQMLTILYRYAALKGYDTAARADVTGFECSDYAAEAVSWAMAHGMVSAADGAALKAPAARCQVAQVLAVFCQTVVMK